MRRSLCCRFCAPIAALIVLLTLANAALAQTITTFDFPSSSSTQPTAINAAGEVTGNYYSGVPGRHGFLRKADGTLISFDAPYEFAETYPVFTNPTSINAAGQITGYVYTMNTFRRTGFVREADGSFTEFSDATPCLPIVNNSSLQRFSTLADLGLTNAEGYTPTGINNRGQIVGVCGEFPPFNQSFVRQRNGTIAAFRVPVDGPTMVRALAINSRGQVTGYYFHQSHGYPGFLRQPDGTFTSFNAVGSNGELLDPIPTAINSNGEITGYAADLGFLRHSDGKMITFQVPGAVITQPTAMNSKGQIVGTYVDSSNIYHGFLREKNGSISTLSLPNASTTYPVGINSRGDITGWYSDATGNHGFVARLKN